MGGDCGAFQTHLLGVPRRLSWSHRRDLCPPAPLTRLPAPAACHPSSGAFTAFCGGVDSRDGPAAAADDDEDEFDEGQEVGEEGMLGPWLGAIGDWTEVPPLSRWRPLEWAEEVPLGSSVNSVKVWNQECSQASAQLLVQGH